MENNKGTLAALLQKVQDQSARQADFLASTADLQKTTDAETGNAQIVIEQNRGEPTRILDVNDHAFGQMSNNIGIDVKTAKRLQDAIPVEFDAVVNKLWTKDPKTRMLRAHMENEETGTARAIVSDKFKTFDNVNLLESTLPQLMESEAQWQVVNGDISEKRLYLRLKSNEQQGTGAAVGDVMANGIGFSNSEVGAGSVSAYQMFWTLACLNGMQSEKKSRWSHITSARDSDQWGMLTDEAKDADNKALELKLRDIIGTYASRDAFDAALEKMRAASGDIIEGEYSAQDTVDNLGRVMQLTKKETSSVLEGLMKTLGQEGYAGNPLSRATMVNAVTAAANRSELDDVDVWQKRGGDVLNMSSRDWQRVAA